MLKIKIIFINLLLLFLLILLIDNLIYYSSHYLPKNFQKYLSYKSQIKYILKNNEDTPFVYEKYIYHIKPEYNLTSLSDGVPISEYIDRFGYSNPRNYLDSDKIEVLLIGDSFTQNPAFSKSMRSFFKEKVYSIGIGGQGIFHWKHQYKRFKRIYLGSSNPKIIVLNYFENDIEDTLRALKYVNAGYTNSVYYPMNGYYDNFEKINRKYSFYNEIYSIFRYFIVSYKVRENLVEFIKTKKIFNQNNISYLKKKISLNTPESPIKYIKYNQDCIIKINGKRKNKFFSKNSSIKITNEIQKMLDLINFEETQVFFSYISAADTIYYEKLQKDNALKDTYSIQKKSSENFNNFFNNSKYPVKYIDVTTKLIDIAKKIPLHPCNGKDHHFSNLGFEKYSKLLSSEIQMHINKNK